MISKNGYLRVGVLCVVVVGLVLGLSIQGVASLRSYVESDAVQPQRFRISGVGIFTLYCPKDWDVAAEFHKEQGLSSIIRFESREDDFLILMSVLWITEPGEETNMDEIRKYVTIRG